MPTACVNLLPLVQADWLDVKTKGLQYSYGETDLNVNDIQNQIDTRTYLKALWKRGK